MHLKLLLRVLYCIYKSPYTSVNLCIVINNDTHLILHCHTISHLVLTRLRKHRPTQNEYINLHDPVL